MSKQRLTTNEIAFAIAVETAEAMHTAQVLVKDAEIAARAKLTAAQHTNCRNCQAGLENFLIEFPYCREEAIEEKHREVWEACPSCRAEYVEFLDKSMNDCQESLDAWADEHAPEAEYSELDGHCFNGDDLRWQNGGA